MVLLRVLAITSKVEVVIVKRVTENAYGRDARN